MGKGNGSFTVSSNFYNNTTRKFNSTVLVQDRTISLSQDAARVASGNDDMASPYAAPAPGPSQ